MSEQVQVREGVWLTRDGEEVEVRARDTTGFNTEWRWEGKRRGYYNTWRDDGTIHIEREQKEGDLVQFLRPLPEAQAEPAPAPAPEPQPVKVREGVWLTRIGAHVEVRRGDDKGPTQFQWVGVLLGINESWRDDGRWSVKDEIHRRDLVQYVKPLPQQTTTDTLAEIEDTVAEIEEALPVNPFEECRRLRAEVCRLQQAHQTMTEHARELLESGQQAREARDSLEQQLATMTAERDNLAQQLWTKPAEEALQKQVAKQQIEINTLQDQLEAMATDRETVWQQLAVMTADRDRLQAELRQARIEIDAEKETPAANCRAVVDAHLIGAQTGRQAAFEAVERWVEVLAGVDSEHAAAVLQALPGCIRKLAELEGVTL